MGEAVKKTFIQIENTKTLRAQIGGEGNLPGRAEVMVIQPPYNRDQFYPQRRIELRRGRISTMIPRSSVPTIGGRKENPCSCLPKISIPPAAKSHPKRRACPDPENFQLSSVIRKCRFCSSIQALRQGHAGQSDNRWMCCGTSAKGD